MKIFKPAILALSISAMVGGCQDQPKETTQMTEKATIESNRVIKSQSDQRGYRYLKLDNGLKILMISDPTTDKSAASLNVSAGAFHTPKDRAGLLHFLEHMLFLGTEKYPKAGEYGEYLKKNGGSSNAYTSSEDTNYFFNVKNDAFDEALDRFAQFFIAPTLDRSYVEREKNAVDSEYSVKIKEDNRRIREVTRRTVNPAHPYSLFSVGNLDTLADREGESVYDALIKIYKEHYSAHRMGLVVLSNESLDAIEVSVKAKFEAVKNNGIAEPVLNSDFLTQDQFAKVVNIEPLRELRSLSLTFAIDDTQQYALQKPTRILTHILNHEGENSLYKRLNDKGLVESFGARLTNDKAMDAFAISMTLTKEGAKNSDAIIEEIFAYLDLIDRVGITETLYNELKSVASLNFAFQEKVTAMSTVSRLSPRLQNTAISNLLNQRSIYSEFNPELTRHFLKQLQPSKMLQTLVAPDLSYDQNEPLYDVNYSINDIEPSLIKRWENVKAADDMKLPSLNPFIAENTDLTVDLSATKPELINEDKGLKLWHYQDISFNVPKSSVFLRIESPMAGDNVKNRAKLVLAKQLINDKLNAYGYDAKLAGLGYRLFHAEKGLGYTVNGYSDKQAVLIEAINKTIIDFDISEDKFQLQKTRLLREWKNSLLARPISQVYSRMSREFGNDSYSSLMLSEALQSVELDELKSYMKAMLSKVSLKVLVHGNTSKSSALALAKNMQESFLSHSTIATEHVSNLQVLKTGSEVINELTIEHADSAIVISYPLERNLKGIQQSRMIAQVLSAAFFNDLRTTQQLGYIVGVNAREIQDMPGVNFYVQSSKVGPVELQKRIEQFIKKHSELVKNMDEKEFAQHKSGLLTNINRKDKNLNGRTIRLWNELNNGFDSFDKRQQLSASITEMTHQDLVSAYETLLLSKQSKRMITRNFGKAHQDEDYKTALKDASVCRQQQCFIGK